MTGPSRIGRFVNVQLLGVTWLTGQLTGTRVGTRVPADLTGVLPFLWVVRAPGTDDWDNANPRLELHSFGADEDAMWTLAGQAHNAMRDLAGQAVNGQLIYTTRTSVDPTEVAWSDTVRRAVAEYELELPVI